MTSSDAAMGADQLGNRRAAEAAPPPVYGGTGAPAPAAPVASPPRRDDQRTSMQRQPSGYGTPGSAPAAPPAYAPDPRRPAPAVSQPPAAAAGGRTRQALLRLARLDPWSVMKVSFVLSVALAVITVVAIAVLWMVLDQMGVFSSISTTVGDISGSNTGGGFNLQSYLSFGNVFGFSLIIALVDIILMTALSTLGTFLYNLAAGTVGGIEVTLAEDD